MTRHFQNKTYGFRPIRSAYDSVSKANGHIQEGNSWPIDIDLKKYFHKVNHDRLIGTLAKRIEDKYEGEKTHWIKCSERKGI